MVASHRRLVEMARSNIQIAQSTGIVDAWNSRTNAIAPNNDSYHSPYVSNDEKRSRSYTHALLDHSREFGARIQYPLHYAWRIDCRAEKLRKPQNECQQNELLR